MSIYRSGFTLIELLVVMAILSILAVIVLVAINPVEQLSKARDAGRISAINQIGHQIQAYFASKEGVYPNVLTWSSDLVDTNQLGTFPQGISYNVSNGVTNCETNQRPVADPTYCYDLDSVNGNGALVFTKLESKNYRSKCTVSGENPYFAYSSADGRGGVVCLSADPAPWVPGSQNYLY